MPLETAPFVASLVASNPANSDNVQQGADHMRLVKAALLATFPTFNAAITATPAQINGWEARIAEAESRLPIGIPQIWLSDTPPTGWLLLQGQEASRTTYPLLFALWGTTHGAGNGTTTFNLPDFRLRFPMGAGAGDAVLAKAGSKTPTYWISAGGAHSHALLAAGWHSHGGVTGLTAITVEQMPPHSHGVNDPGHTHGVYDPGHQHSYIDRINVGGLEANVNGPGTGGTDLERLTNVGHAGISIYGAGTGIWLSNNGSGHGHTHDIAADGGHTHGVEAATDHYHTAATADARPPYFAVNFMVRGL